MYKQWILLLIFSLLVLQCTVLLALTIRYVWQRYNNSTKQEDNTKLYSKLDNSTNKFTKSLELFI